jgi:DNA replication protein DnaC
MKDKGILTPDQKIRVFVSSTINELKSERKEVKKVIKDDLKLHPIMFEAGASPHPPGELYRAWLEQSQIYVGIFWESYGWVAPDMKISGIEDEYEIAKHFDLDRLVYVKNTSKGRERRLQNLIKKIEKEGDISYTAFDTPEELANIVKNDIARLLTERYMLSEKVLTEDVTVNYFDSVKNNIDKCGFVGRSGILSEIQNILESESKILLFGEPGCGKTFLLGKIGEKTDCVYISIRDKTPLYIYTYLTNRAAATISRLPEKFNSVEEASFALETTLQNSKLTFLIDDVDRNISLAKSLMNLEYYQNRVIFAARNEAVLGSYSFRKMTVQSFQRQEIENYLTQKNIKLSPSRFLKLLHSCNGNPLYLYYFTNYQMDPLPDGLEAYQDALWREFDSKQKELLVIISISLFPSNIEFLHEAFNITTNSNKSIFEIESILTKLSPILHIINSHYEIFHPYFQEHIIKKIDELGLTHKYHKILGETCFEKRNIVETTYHFMRAQDKRADAKLIEAAHNAFSWGLWDIAEEFLRHKVEINQKNNDICTGCAALHPWLCA